MTIKYTSDHEWVSLDGEIGTVGITDFAQQQLGELVFVELPDVGNTVSTGDETGVLESVKAASELYAPVSGEIIEANNELEGNPTKVNEDPTGEGWIFKIKLANQDEFAGLMDENAYKAFLKENE